MCNTKRRSCHKGDTYTLQPCCPVADSFHTCYFMTLLTAGHYLKETVLGFI